MLRVLRFFVGGIFFVIGILIMPQKDVKDIFIKTVQKRDELLRLSEKHEVYR